MKFTRGIPRSQRLPGFAGRFVVDTVRGVLRVRAWPKKRGTPKSAAQLFWIDWFRQANLLAKYADAQSMISAIELTKGSRWYPRDILLKAMRGRLLYLTDTTGWRWYPVAATNDVSNSLDTLAQTVGSVLVRAVDRWRAPPAGVLGNVLTNQGPGAPPIWAGSSGGIEQAELSNSPIVADDTVNEYVFAVAGFVEIVLTMLEIDFGTSDQAFVRFSTDGGVSYKSGATDYWMLEQTSTNESSRQKGEVPFSAIKQLERHIGSCTLQNLQAPQSSYQLMGGIITNQASSRMGFTTFVGPITHVKIFSKDGFNFKAGTIRAVGTKLT